MLYCFHTTGGLHTFVLYNFLGPGTSFYRKVFLKIIWFSLNQFSDSLSCIPEFILANASLKINLMFSFSKKTYLLIWGNQTVNPIFFKYSWYFFQIQSHSKNAKLPCKIYAICFLLAKEIEIDILSAELQYFFFFFQLLQIAINYFHFKKKNAL